MFFKTISLLTFFLSIGTYASLFQEFSNSMSSIGYRFTAIAIDTNQDSRVGSYSVLSTNRSVITVKIFSNSSENTISILKNDNSNAYSVRSSNFVSLKSYLSGTTFKKNLSTFLYSVSNVSFVEYIENMPRGKISFGVRVKYGRDQQQMPNAIIAGTRTDGSPISTNGYNYSFLGHQIGLELFFTQKSRLAYYLGVAYLIRNMEPYLVSGYSPSKYQKLETMALQPAIGYENGLLSVMAKFNFQFGNYSVPSERFIADDGSSIRYLSKISQNVFMPSFGLEVTFPIIRYKSFRWDLLSLEAGIRLYKSGLDFDNYELGITKDKFLNLVVGSKIGFVFQ